ASISGSFTFKDGASEIQSTNNNTLTIGGNSTGNIILADAVIFQSTFSLNNQTFSNLVGDGLQLDGTTLETVLGTTVELDSAETTGILPVVKGGSPFEQANGSIFERITTQDFLLGGTSTESARFAFINVAGGIPTASLSAGSNNNTFLSADGNLGTTNA